MVKGIGQRLELLIKESGKSNYTVARDIEVNDSTISRIINKDQKPRSKTIKKISDYFQVFEKWLLTGTGPKYRNNRLTAREIVHKNLFSEGNNQEASGIRFLETTPGNFIMLSPLVLEESYMNFLKFGYDLDFVNTLPVHPVSVSSSHEGLYLSFEVIGKEMFRENYPYADAIHIVTARNIDKEYWSSRFFFSNYQVFVIIHKEGILIREISSLDIEKGTIVVHAYNEKYDDVELKLSDCKYIMNVVDINWRI